MVGLWGWRRDGVGRLGGVAIYPRSRPSTLPITCPLRAVPTSTLLPFTAETLLPALA